MCSTICNAPSSHGIQRAGRVALGTPVEALGKPLCGGHDAGQQKEAIPCSYSTDGHDTPVDARDDADEPEVISAVRVPAIAM
jgi:hypothetical protein